MEKIVLWNKENSDHKRIRKVRLMDREHYERIREFILSRFRESQAVSLMSILEPSSPLPTREFGVLDVMPLIILVKNDLEARGILKVIFNQDRTQTIVLKKKSFSTS